MDAEMKQALEDSIVHWKEMRDKPWIKKPSDDECPLCKLIASRTPSCFASCRGCVVRVHTGLVECHDTPFFDAIGAWHCLSDMPSDCSISALTWIGLSWRIAADREIAFLESLRGRRVVWKL